MRKWRLVVRYSITAIGTMRKGHLVVRYFISAIGTNGTMRKWHLCSGPSPSA
jgi:hypothetical protein